MIHVVTSVDRAFYADQLRQMHALRKARFVDELNWPNMTVVRGGEFDQFDDERTVYLLSLDAHGQVAASVRARPTDDRSLLADVFPQLAGSALPRVSATNVWELSRIVAAPGFRGEDTVDLRRKLYAGCVEAALDAGVDRLLAVVEAALLPRVLDVGWRARALAKAASCGGEQLAAVEVDVSVDELERFRYTLGLDRRVTLPTPWRQTGDAAVNRLAPQELEALLNATSPPAGRILTLLAERIVDLQDRVPEGELLALIDYVGGLAEGRMSLH